VYPYYLVEGAAQEFSNLKRICKAKLKVPVKVQSWPNLARPGLLLERRELVFGGGK
jgi:hypothetical protein